MPFLVVLVIAIVVLLVAKSLYDAHQLKAAQDDDAPSTPMAAPDRPRPARPRPRRRSLPQIDEEALAEHVAKLRSAVNAGLVTEEEAVASIVRHADGALSEDAARQLLADRDAA